MIPSGLVSMDLDESWGPEDAGAAIDAVPAPILVALMSQTHDVMHGQYAKVRRTLRRRPWRWHKLRQLARDERTYCKELGRRRELVLTVYRARCAEAA